MSRDKRTRSLKKKEYMNRMYKTYGMKWDNNFFVKYIEATEDYLNYGFGLFSITTVGEP